jgi:hypothetical protein
VFCRDAGDGEVDGEDGADDPQLAIASEILPPIPELLPNLKSKDPKESAAAAAEMVALNNNTSTEEDTLVGRSGALEVLGQVLGKGNEEGRVTAASALANLIANSDANKKSILAMPEVIPAILNVSLVSDILNVSLVSEKGARGAADGGARGRPRAGHGELGLSQPLLRAPGKRARSPGYTGKTELVACEIFPGVEKETSMKKRRHGTWGGGGEGNMANRACAKQIGRAKSGVRKVNALREALLPRCLGCDGSSGVALSAPIAATELLTRHRVAPELLTGLFPPASQAQNASVTLGAQLAAVQAHRRHGPTIPGCPAGAKAALLQASPIPPFPISSVFSSLLPLPFSPKPHFSVAPPSFHSSLIRVPLSESPLPQCPDVWRERSCERGRERNSEKERKKGDRLSKGKKEREKKSEGGSGWERERPAWCTAELRRLPGRRGAWLRMRLGREYPN